VSFEEKLKTSKFLVTSEVGPPKGTDMSKLLEEALLVKGRVDAINVTDLQSAVMRVGSLATCKLLLEKGLEPILQLTCRDRNRLSLQSELLSAYVLGIRNVLCLTGDHTTLGDHPEAKPVFDLDSVQLLQVATGLMEGKDMAGNPLQGTPHFCLGAVVNPGADPLEPQLFKMELKIKAGAKFFQTQAVYDLKIFEKFMKEVEKWDVPVLGGIVLLKSAGMAKYMNENVAGVYVPDELIKRMAEAKKEDRPKVSVEIAAELIKGFKDLCRGVHIMPIGWDWLVPQVLDAAGL